MLTLCCIVLFASCRKSDEDKEMISRSYAVNEFRTINVKGVADIYLVQDTLYSVEFRGMRYVLDGSGAVSENNILTLTSKPKGAYLRPGDPTIEMYIHVDTLERINIMESCNIRTMNALTGKEIGVVVDTKMSRADLELACETFYYWNNPNGYTMNLRGQVDQLKVWNSGLGNIDASKLYAGYVEVVNGGHGDCKVRASGKIVYSLTSVGNIYYYGNPAQLEPVLVNSSGQLIKAD